MSAAGTRSAARISGGWILKNLKISTRLTILVSVLLILSGVIGGVGLYSSNSSRNSLKQVYEDRLLPIVELNLIMRGNLRNRVAMSNGLLQPQHMAEFIKVIEANNAENKKQWNAYISHDLETDEKVLAEKFNDANVRFISEGINPALSAMKNGDTDALKKYNLNASSRFLSV